jgi:spore coat polysaccharide biosynthesis protein SpsF
MRVIGVVQARMGSTRLPGKVLMDLGGRTALGLQLLRLRRAALDELVVATSDRSIDDAIVAEAATVGVCVVRGPEHDVLGRFGAVLQTVSADDVVRLTADCPLTDPHLVDDIVARHRAAKADYTSNTIIRSFPDGLDVEVVSRSALEVALQEATAEEEREHVTPFIYRRPERFRLAQFVGDFALERERWTLDTKEDLERLRDIVMHLDDPITASWTAVLRVAGIQAHRRPFDVVPDVGPPHDAAHRRWSVEKDGAVLGQAEVDVADGVGHLIVRWNTTVTEAEREAARDAVRSALRADLQVRELVSADGP